MGTYVMSLPNILHLHHVNQITFTLYRVDSAVRYVVEDPHKHTKCVFVFGKVNCIYFDEIL